MADITVIVRGAPREIVCIFVVRGRSPGEIPNCYATATAETLFRRREAVADCPLFRLHFRLIVVLHGNYSPARARGEGLFYPDSDPFSLLRV